jgi:hypothetical protein
MSFLKGKPAESKNLAYPMISKQYSGTARDLIGQGQGGLNSLLGILQGTDNGAGYETYKNSTGYNNIFDEAMRGVTGSAAARGLLASGSTVRGLADRGGQLAQQNFSNYLGQLLGVSQAQLQGGQGVLNTIAGTGQVNKGATPGLLDAFAGGSDSGAAGLGRAAAGVGKFILSDRRAKDDIVLLEREPDGLGIYSFRYKGDDAPQIGVMADEVAELRPHALGPVVEGFATVVYEAL